MCDTFNQLVRQLQKTLFVSVVALYGFYLEISTKRLMHISYIPTNTTYTGEPADRTLSKELRNFIAAPTQFSQAPAIS